MMTRRGEDEEERGGARVGAVQALLRREREQASAKRERGRLGRRTQSLIGDQYPKTVTVSKT